jgi:hypothetical protein
MPIIIMHLIIYGYTMLTDLNSKLDLTLKSLSLFFTFFLFLGAIILWAYLNSVSLSSELLSFVTSPQVLFSIALYSIFLTLGIFVLIIFLPGSIHYFENGKEFGWKEQALWGEQWFKKRYFFHLSFLVAPLVFNLIGILLLDLQGFTYLITFLTFCLIASIVFYCNFSADHEIKKSNIDKFFTLYFYMLIVYGVSLLVLTFLMGVVVSLFNNDYLQWGVLSFLVITYCFLSTIASTNGDFKSFIPLLLVTFIWLIIFFTKTGATQIMSTLQMGHFSSTFSIEEKYVSAVKKPFNIKYSKDGKVATLNKVWVLSNSGNKLIISPDENSKVRVSLPTKMILNEILSME